MNWSTLQSIISGLDSTWIGTTVYNEAHVIPVSAPYAIYLARIPKVLSTGTSVHDNLYSSVADMVTAGISLTIAGSPATLTASSSPASGQAYFQIIESTYGYSTKVIFNSADAGKAVSVNYTGYMGNVSGHQITRLQEAVGRLESYPDCTILSSNDYSGGRFDNSVADDTSITILAARGQIEFVDGPLDWATGSADLSAAGDPQVSAFSTYLSGWKRIGVWLIHNGVSAAIRIMESAEAATQGALTDPDDYATDALYCGYLDVQGDGTGNAGGIENIAQAVITTDRVTLKSSRLQTRTPLKVEWVIAGGILAGANADVAQFPGIAGTPAKCTLINHEMGDDDTNLQIDILIDGSTSIFGTKPVIALGGGASTIQMDSSTTFAASPSWTSSEYLTLTVDTVSANAQDMRILLWYYPDESV